MSDECEHTEQWSVIKFLVEKNKTNTEIMKEQTSMYGMHMLKSTVMKKLAGHFQIEKESWAMMLKLVYRTVCNARNVEKVKEKSRSTTEKW